MRIGHGFDAHRLVEGRKLMLGGVDVPYARGLEGHSDGDVLVHAVIDALLGAAGLGDIGGMFPSGDARWSGADSVDLLVKARERVEGQRMTTANVDATVVCQTPKLAPFIEEMRRRLAAALGVDITDVNVKATTSDGLGFTGRGEGIAAFAVVLLDSVRIT
jgi:2-C-methyl-D-erythritol 2,4-cyclodiphosphate synthase